MKLWILILIAGLAGAGVKGADQWQITYNGNLKVAAGTDYVIIDLFDYGSRGVATVKAAGAKPIAYFSAHYEDWRPDKGQFGRKLGKIGGWKGEYYIDWTDPRNQTVMLSRLERASRLGYWGVDMDNVDGPGMGGYFAWLYKAAKAKGLAVGLKNSVELLPTWGAKVDFFVSEATNSGELTCYKPYILPTRPAVRMCYSRKVPTPAYIAEVWSKTKGSKY